MAYSNYVDCCSERLRKILFTIEKKKINLKMCHMAQQIITTMCHFKKSMHKCGWCIPFQGPADLLTSMVNLGPKCLSPHLE